MNFLIHRAAPADLAARENNMIRSKLTTAITEALNTLGYLGQAISLERPEHSDHGDYMTNVALVYAKQAGVAPRAFAEQVVAELKKNDGGFLKDIQIAGPGFINFFMKEEALAEDVTELSARLEQGLDVHKGEKVNIEFISANPTGDLHIGHGRGAFFGDVLARVLAYAGAAVTREFYINDSRESNQIKELGKTGLGQGVQYKTPRLEKMIAEMEFEGFAPENVGFALAEKVQAHNRNFIEKKLGISFDEWYSEDAQIRESGAGDKMLALLKEKGLLYEKDGATWIKTSEYGDDEDRVVLRSDGTKSYFIADIAYHAEKFARGFNTVIDVWGADHHGHVKRMHAVGKVLVWPKNPPQPIIFIAQLVALKEGDERKKMSKRAGNVILLEDLVDELGIDVVRWFFTEKALGSHMDFDLALAREHSAKNPVFYVQYAHARIASIIAKAQGLAPEDGNLAELFTQKSARNLAVKITQFGETIEDTACDFQVHRLTTYAYELANAFSQFYRDVRVTTDTTYSASALELAMATKQTLAKTLGLLGISAPEKVEREEK